MEQIDRIMLGRSAREAGFVRDTFEKAYRLVRVLDAFQNDSLLSDRLALKGGTAINMTVFNLPRLSVDIDLDLSENLSRNEMMLIRESIKEHIFKHMASSDYSVSPRSKSYHALDSFVFEYHNTGGMKDNIKIEINYMLRCHVFPIVKRSINLPFAGNDCSILCVDPLETFSSKIVALLNRAAPRDLFDVYQMFQNDLFDDSEMSLLKKCTMFYYAIGADAVPSQFNFDSMLAISQQQIKTDLIPVLQKGSWFDVLKAQKEVVGRLEKILVPSPNELSFWSEFEKQNYRPDLLFDDTDIIERISNHPMAIWKCVNKLESFNTNKGKDV